MCYWKRTLLAALLVLAVAAPAFSGAQAPPTRTETLLLEGEPETYEATEYREEGLFSLWFDARHFGAVRTEEGVRFELLDNALDGPVSFSVESADGLRRENGDILDDVRAGYLAEGWETIAAEASDPVPGFHFEQDPVAGFAAMKGGQTARVFLAEAASGAWLVTLRCPAEAAEGWGARMEHMLGSLRPLPGE